MNRHLYLLYALILIQLSITLPSAVGAESSDLENSVEMLLSKATDQLKTILNNSLGGLDVQLRLKDLDTSSQALIGIWLMSDDDAQIELEWWRSTVPELRMLSATLLLSGRDENTTNVPFLDETRFKSAEEVKRQLELKLIAKNAPKLGKLLKTLITKAYGLHPTESIKNLRTRFSIFAD